MDLFGGGLEDTIISIGLLGTFLILFAESGLLIGFFLPGDSLLFTAGLLASQGYFSIWYLLIGGSLAAIIGDNVGYRFGRRYGHRIFNKQESIFFHQDHVRKAEEFYQKHGPLTVILARFVPVVRTFAPILAGVGKMEYRKFLLYNITGGLLWVWGLGLLGHWAGKTIPNIDRYILPGVAIVIIVSAIPGIVALIRQKIRRIRTQAKSDPNR
ncbi:MAG: hypothetical protein UX60_C0016G0008 [Berkelbacteria bacterium GW2011_GWA2_46_7]|uniref:VTT domain-containing protein n=1 Tax=Berkelbacteria bacterium GW2011_GWA2_46_7 TaxID=1618335 RepID=A0A0G1QFN9_9BACT|nr:MAG: hypothetical protein UX60_C0016G0008 [Berkelbacteria bacterium GW2011_GWA2_46_7]